MTPQQLSLPGVIICPAKGGQRLKVNSITPLEDRWKTRQSQGKVNMPDGKADILQSLRAGESYPDRSIAVLQSHAEQKC